MSKPAEDLNGSAKRLGQRIGRLRCAMRPRMSEEALATRIGVPNDYVPRLERGEVDLPLSLAVRLATVLGVPITTLVSDAREELDALNWRRVAREALGVFEEPDGAQGGASSAIQALAGLIASYLLSEQATAPRPRRRAARPAPARVVAQPPAPAILRGADAGGPTRIPAH